MIYETASFVSTVHGDIEMLNTRIHVVNLIKEHNFLKHKGFFVSTCVVDILTTGILQYT